MRTGLAVTVLSAMMFAPAAARAQDTKSVELARQLTGLLDQKKLDAIATPDSQNPGAYIAALYFPGTQLLVVSAKYSAPQLLTELLARKEYRAVYAELSSASVPGSKVLVNDIYANGLMVKPSGSNPPDSIEGGATPATFDGAWRKAKIAEADYMKSFAEAEATYTRALQALITQLKTPGTSSN
jgi:hypothetical protein